MPPCFVSGPEAGPSRNLTRTVPGFQGFREKDSVAVFVDPFKSRIKFYVNGECVVDNHKAGFGGWQYDREAMFGKELGIYVMLDDVNDTVSVTNVGLNREPYTKQVNKTQRYLPSPTAEQLRLLETVEKKRQEDEARRRAAGERAQREALAMVTTNCLSGHVRDRESDYLFGIFGIRAVRKLS